EDERLALLDDDRMLPVGLEPVEERLRRQDGQIAVLAPLLDELGGRSGEEQPVQGGPAVVAQAVEIVLRQLGDAGLGLAALQGLGTERLRPAAGRITELA